MTKPDDFYRLTAMQSPAVFMHIFSGVPWAGASNDSGVVENGNFQRFRWLFLGKL